MGRVICVCNQKGGVGKTTTAVNLASCMALAEKRSLLVDLDPQANASSGLGIRLATQEPSIYQLLLAQTLFDGIVRGTALKYLDLLPSSQDLIGAEVEFIGLASRERMLATALSGIRGRYDYIFIDCPPSLGLLTVNALVAADSVLVPIQCEYYALEGVGSLMKTIRRIQSSFNPSLELEGVVLTMFDPRNNLNHQVVEDVRKHFTDKVFATIIPRNVRLSEAPSFGKPVVLYDIASRGATSYLSLSKEILDGKHNGNGETANGTRTGA